jgi:ABC-2 type transport system permease protein
MINIWRLTKLQLLSTFGLHKIFHATDRKERRKSLLLSLGIVLGVLLLGVVSFYYSLALSLSFASLGRLDLLLAIMMAVASITGFFTTIYKASGVLFSGKDYDLVMSLPIKTSQVVASRILHLYVFNLFFTLLIMVPAGLVYALKVNPSGLFYLCYILTLCFIPLIPLIAATVIAALISWISSRFKASRMIGLVLTIAAVILVVFGPFRLNGMNGMNGMNGNMSAFVDQATQLADGIYRLYPLTSLYIDAVCQYRFVPLLLFVGLSVGSFMLFATVLGTRYKAIHTGLTTSSTSRSYRMKSLVASSPFHALYKKELRRFFSSSLYVLNSSLVVILLLVMSIALLFTDSEKLGEMMKIPQLGHLLQTLAPLVVSVFVTLSCTTSSSISLEGKHLWILQCSPVSKLSVLLSKIAVNLTVTVPILLISGCLLILSLRPGWIEAVLLLVIPLIYACFTAILGVIVNLKFPRLDWTNEVMVVKQGAAVLITMAAGFISTAIPIGLSFTLTGVNSNLLLAAVGLVMVVICLLLYRWLQRKGEALFQAISSK